MATGGENVSYSIGSEDFNEIVCDPCQEDGELHKAVGMCIDCQDHLCQKCFDAHKISKLSRKHELLGKEAMLQSQVSIIKDTCTEKCAVHEEEVIKYYCINHSHLGCSVCITLDHRTCDSVRYIPHVAKDLANSEEYQQVESQLISVVGRSKKVTKDNKQKSESLQKDCSEAVKMVQKFRNDINKVLDKVETDLLHQCETVKSVETAKIAQIVDKLKSTQRELYELMDMKEAYQNNNQNCKLYTRMMKIKDTLKLAKERMEEAENEQSHINSQIKFVPNKETLNTLKLPETIGKLVTSGTSSILKPEKTKPLVRQGEQTISRISGTSSNVSPEQPKTPVRQKEQTTSGISKPSNYVSPEQPQTPVRQKDQTTSRISKPSNYVSPEQPQTPVRQKEQTTSRISGTSSNVRPEQPQTPVRQQDQTTSRISGKSSYVSPEQIQTPVRQQDQTTSEKRTEANRIVSAEYIQDINVKCKVDKEDCNVCGLVVLPGNRLVLTDWDNGNVKLVDVNRDKVITYLPLSPYPWDVAMVTNCQVAITGGFKVAMVNVTATAKSVDRTLVMDGDCRGVDYRDGKLAVSFCTPHKVQVLTLHGNVLYTITKDQQGHDLFNFPFYVALGQDSASLFVSNLYSDNVVHVKFDGTVVGTYTDSEAKSPHGLLTDSIGHIYLCGFGYDNIHQMTPDCRKVQVLLTKADGLHSPQCISYSETDRRLYVGTDKNVVKVYRAIIGSK